MKTILKSPLITEKNTMLAEASVYVFEVGMNASKPEIKEAVEDRPQIEPGGVVGSKRLFNHRRIQDFILQRKVAHQK